MEEVKIDLYIPGLEVHKGDYIGKNGLLYCGKCHTPRQFILTAVAPDCIVPSLCRCEAAERDRLENMIRRGQDTTSIENRRNEAFEQSGMKDWTFSHDDRKNAELTRKAKIYVDNFEEIRKKGAGLLFYGSVGTGKSYMAVCIANALIDKGYKSFVTNFSRMINEITMAEDKQKYLDYLNQYDLLVIDDFAVERDTDYVNEIVSNIINSRYIAKKPMIVTTNLTMKELSRPENVNKARVYSRLLEMCVPVEVNGSDRRMSKARANAENMWKG